MARTEPAPRRTVGGKEGGEVPENMPMSRTLVSRLIGRELLSPHPTIYMEMETDLVTKNMVGVAATVHTPPPNSKGEP